MSQPKVIVLRTAGTNCDEETAFAFRYFGASVDLVHINFLLNGEVFLNNYHVLVLPGGFTYGDNIESGRILANELTLKLGDDISHFINDKKLVIGICNGFQILVKAGLLPGPLGCGQTVTLTHNDSGKFEDRWSYLSVSGKSVWTNGMEDMVYFPSAHAEGKFIVEDQNCLKSLIDSGQVAFRYSKANGGQPKYPDNPNGSIEDIAGITDKTGRILGLMPHPERHFLFHHHPRWTRIKQPSVLGSGAKIFENGVRYIKEQWKEGL